jgi:hypothetical protein
MHIEEYGYRILLQEEAPYYFMDGVAVNGPVDLKEVNMSVGDFIKDGLGSLKIKGNFDYRIILLFNGEDLYKSSWTPGDNLAELKRIESDIRGQIVISQCT